MGIAARLFGLACDDTVATDTVASEQMPLASHLGVEEALHRMQLGGARLGAGAGDLRIGQ